MRRYVCAVLIIVAGVKTIAQSDVSTARWLQQPVTVDGKATEWNEPLSFYDAGTRLFFAIANDSSTLYLCFESRDEMSQAKLMRGGMKIILSSKGKPRHEVSIAYPLTQKEAVAEQELPGAGGQRVHDRSSFRQHFLSVHNQMTVEGFATAKGSLPLMNATGVVAAMNWDTASNLIYEIAIPEKEFFGDDYRNPGATAATLTLDVVLNALPKEETPDDTRNRPNSGEEPGERRGQFNGGGYGTGNEGIRPDMVSGEGTDVSLRSKSSFKQKFVFGKAG